MGNNCFIKSSLNALLFRIIPMRQAVLGIFLLMFFLGASAQSNFTVTSVSTSEVFTKTTQPSQAFWIINTQFNGGGQSITGTITPDSIKGFTNGKAYPKDPLSITTETVNEQIFYEVVNEGVPIYKYRVQTFDALELRGAKAHRVLFS